MGRTTRPWTTADRQTVGEMKAFSRTNDEIGAAIGRTGAQAGAIATYFGFAYGRKRAQRSRRPVVRRLHAEGLTVLQMARKLKTTGSTLYKDHRALGLTPNAMSHEESGRRSFSETWRKNRRSPCVLGLERERCESVRLGWPAVEKGARRHLGLIEESGPTTASPHAGRLGITAGSACEMLKRLVRAGHLAASRGPGTHGRLARPVYALSPATVAGRRALAARSESVPRGVRLA